MEIALELTDEVAEVGVDNTSAMVLEVDSVVLSGGTNVFTWESVPVVKSSDLDVETGQDSTLLAEIGVVAEAVASNEGVSVVNAVAYDVGDASVVMLIKDWVKFSDGSVLVVNISKVVTLSVMNSCA